MHGIHRFGPVAWGVVILCGLATAAVGPTLLGGAIGYVIIFRRQIAAAVSPQRTQSDQG